ncbi:Lrp/AsnC family transcriptional regulator [Halorutilales archaeon Cl-col2-1]
MTKRRDLIEALSKNARLSSEDLARLTGLDEDRVESLIEEMEDEGIIRGYQAIVDWEEIEGEYVRAMIELNVTLDRETSYDDVARRISKFSKVHSLKLVSGNYDFALEVEAESMAEISNFVSEKIAPVPEVTQTVTHLIMRTYKEGGTELTDSHDDDRLSVSP